MSVIRVTKEFSFEMAHVLQNYDGLCNQLHGHSYRLFVTVKGRPDANPISPKLGMVMDFSSLKRIVNELIVEKYDHALVIRETEGKPAVVDALKSVFDRIIITKYQPTCENMVADFADAISAELPSTVRLHSVKLYETATSYAEWFDSDN